MQVWSGVSSRLAPAKGVWEDYHDYVVVCGLQVWQVRVMLSGIGDGMVLELIRVCAFAGVGFRVGLEFG